MIWAYKTGDVGIHTRGVTGSIPVPPTIFKKINKIRKLISRGAYLLIEPN
jgi:hypothetical protein